MPLRLASLGFTRGDKAAIVGDNRPELYWAVTACQGLGGVPVPIYQDSIEKEMEHRRDKGPFSAAALTALPQRPFSVVRGGGLSVAPVAGSVFTVPEVTLRPLLERRGLTVPAPAVAPPRSPPRAGRPQPQPVPSSPSALATIAPGPSLSSPTRVPPGRRHSSRAKASE